MIFVRCRHCHQNDDWKAPRGWSFPSRDQTPASFPAARLPSRKRRFCPIRPAMHFLPQPRLVCSDRRTASRSAECPSSRRSAQPQQRQEAEGRGQRHSCSRAEFTALCISKLAATPSCAPRTQAVAQDSTTDSTTALGTRRAEETALKLNPTSAIRLEICASEKSVSLIRRQTPTSSSKTSVLTITH
jgi:hypothetical protein